MTTTPKTTYAQSSDIRARSHLEYRRDMKRKAIAELEFIPFLQSALIQKHGDKSITVVKYGGDAALWFGRSDRQVTQEPDYRAESGTGELYFYEFQYAEESERLRFFDFKLSKVGKKKRGQPRVPHTDREFFYVVKPELQYAFITPEWIMRHGREGSVPAWGSRPAYRVPKDVFLKECTNGGLELEATIRAVDDRNYLLEFQHEFLNDENQRFSRRLQQVVDEEALIRIVPKTLDGFYIVCYLLDKIQKAPDAPSVWLMYLLSFFREDMRAMDFARFMHAFDFLYFKCAELRENELYAIRPMLDMVKTYISNRVQDNGSLASDPNEAPVEETRQILFAVNLLEDIMQDAIVSWNMELPPIRRIFQTIHSVRQTASFLRAASAQTTS